MSLSTVFLSGLLAGRLQAWFGAWDLAFLVLWFLPLGVSTALVAGGLAHPEHGQSTRVRVLAVVVLGPGLGFLWTYLVANLMGPWWGAVSLPALMCWMLGALAGVAAGVVLGPQPSVARRLGTGIALSAVVVAAVVANRPLLTWASHDQRLVVRFLRWTPGDEALVVETEMEPVGDDVVALLREAGIVGRVRLMWAGGTYGQGQDAAAFIVLRAPLEVPVALRQPDRRTALYVQSGRGFATYPAGVSTLDREILLRTQGGGTWCSVRDADGGLAGGHEFDW
jgi:hypothetical protein